ncbi:MAG: ATP-dependent Clp protease ATP-binding subunit [Pyrinomonadaceae bacterium]|nr:ATP-dependent Clp protease ATP-binding subunit [Pyrinomonadaceae bacterium]
MFERYTEKARRVIFFARYEALQYGSLVILPEHLLLGLMREDKTISPRFFPFRHNISVDTIRREVEERIVLRERIPQSAELHLAPETKQILAFANEESERFQAGHLGVEHLLLGILREEASIAAEILFGYGVQLSAVREKVGVQKGSTNRRRRRPEKETPNLQEFTRDLTAAALDRKLDPLIGREDETERLVEILCRRTKNNPVLIGESGVGKTAIIEGLAQRIADKNVPSFLASKRILTLDLSLIVAGTKYRGQFEERLKKIMSELSQNKECIVFIDEIHTLVGAGSAEGSLDAANILKPSLSRGEIQCIGATTPGEYKKSIEKDRSLERRFQAVKILPPTEEEALAILEGVATKYEVFHQIRYSKDALKAAVYQTNRYIPERFLPDKAIDVLDEAGARAKLRYEEENGSEPSWKETVENWKRVTDEENLISLELKTIEESFLAVEVSKDDVEEVIARWTGIPIQSIKQEEASKLLKIEEKLHESIISQRDAISALARAIRRSRAGLKNPARPVGSFLFLGPTGVGKTEVARKLAGFLFGSESALVRFDMSEYMEKHTVAKFIGSPPGYVGHEEGGQLTEKLRRTPYSIVLFDEVEKAHPDLFSVLLQVFEDGKLTDAQGNEVDCKNAVFIMTSNIGARFIQKRATLGFQSSDQASRGNMEDQVMSEVKKTFAPEFINRLDEIIIFDELTDEDLLQIIDLQIGELNDILTAHSLTIALTEDAKQWLIDKTCADRTYGARPLRRALQKYVEDELSEALIQGDFEEEKSVEVFCQDDTLKLRPLPVKKKKNKMKI